MKWLIRRNRKSALKRAAEYGAAFLVEPLRKQAERDGQRLRPTSGGDFIVGTTSAVPMLHIAGITPEADLPLAESIDRVEITQSEFLGAWRGFNEGDAQVDLVAIGSPHASADECRSFLKFLSDRKCNDDVPAIITLGRDVRAEIDRDGTAAALVEAGVTLVSDTCWCMITKPVFPPDTIAVMTNSGKYAHYGPGLSGCRVRFGAMAACAEAAVTGRAYIAPPGWMLD